jgi:hypothetical protein
MIISASLDIENTQSQKTKEGKNKTKTLPEQSQTCNCNRTTSGERTLNPNKLHKKWDYKKVIVDKPRIHML